MSRIASSKRRRSGTDQERSGGGALPSALAADTLVYALFLLVPIAWSSAPLEPFVPAKALLFAFLACAAAGWRATDLLDWTRELPRNSGDLRIAVLVGWAAISALASSDPGSGLATVANALPFVAVFALLRTSADSRTAAVHATLAAALVNALVGLGQCLHLPLFLFGAGEEPIGLLGNRNHLAAFLAVALPLFVLPDDGKTRPIFKSTRSRIAGALVCLTVLCLTRSRGAMLAAVAGSFVLYLTRLPESSRRREVAKWAFALALGAVAVASASTPTARARALTWKLTAHDAMRHPVLGHGPGSFENDFPRMQEAYFREIDRNPAKLAAGEWQFARNHRQAHNDWLQILYELGFPAAFLLLGLVAEAVANRGASAAARAAVASLAVVGLTSFPLELVPTAMLAVLVLSIALPAWSARERDPAEAPWSLGPRAWIAAAVFLFACHATALYLSAAAHGAGWRYFDAGKQAESERALKRALFYNPGDGQARALLARVFDATGRKKEALQLFEHAAADHLDAAVLVNQGIVLRSLGDKPRALESFRRAVAMLPSDSDTWYFLGLELDESGQLAAADDALARAKSLSIENYKAWFDAARLALAHGQKALAEKLFRENVDWLMAKMSEEDPSLKRIDLVKRDWLAMNAEKLEGMVGEKERATVIGRVKKYFGAAE